jgi:outer membrane protein assembly factor BamB
MNRPTVTGIAVDGDIVAVLRSDGYVLCCNIDTIKPKWKELPPVPGTYASEENHDNSSSKGLDS